MELGKDLVSDQKVILPWKLRSQTHMHVIGASRSGKSKLLEHMIREDTDHGTGFCLIDYHGTLYRDVLEWLAYRRPDRDIILLNLSVPDYITPFNPFRQREGDISALVSRHIDSTIKPWGMKDTNETPNLERICRIFYHFVAVSGESIGNASMLLRYPKRELRDYAIRQINDSWIAEQWRELQHVKSLREWREQVMSTNNRLGRFIASRAIRRFTGLGSGLDIRQIMDERTILLVNIARSRELPPDAAKVFAALLLSEFFDEAMSRAKENPDTYVLYLDEFQKYITEDMADMLDEVLKGGLHLVLAHQRMGHLLRDEDVKDAITTNAKIKAVFGGLPYPSACEMANELYLSEINEAQNIRKFQRTAVVDYQVVELNGSSFGTSDAQSETHGEFDSRGEQHGGAENFTTHQSLKPVLAKEDVPSPYWSREEKLSRRAETLIRQAQAECTLKIPHEPIHRTQVFKVRPGYVGEEAVADYERELYLKQGAIPADEADRLLVLKEQEFIFKASEPGPEEYSKRKKSARSAEV